MKCKNHQNEIAIEKCSSCGQWFCDDCIKIIDKQALCNICLGERTPQIYPNLNKNFAKEIVTDVSFNPKSKVVLDKQKKYANDPVIIEENGQTIILNSQSDIKSYNRYKKNEILKSRNGEVVSYEFYRKRSLITKRIIAGGILIALCNPVTVFIGAVLIITALIDKR